MSDSRELRQQLCSPTLVELRARQSAKWREYGDEVVPAWIAEMDFPLAGPIREALHEAVDRSDTGYAFPSARLARAASEFLARRHGWEPAPHDVYLTGDVNIAIRQALALSTRPGARVAVHVPAYPPFYDAIREIGREVAPAPLLLTDGVWRVDLAGLERLFAEGVTAYLFNNPHNPTGRVFTADEVHAVGELAARYGVAVVSDEVHSPLTLPGSLHSPWPSATATTRHDAPVFVATGATKAFNLAGLKCGQLVAVNDAAREAAARLPHEVPFQASILGVIASEAAYERCDDWLDALLGVLEENRASLGEAVRTGRLPDVSWVPPQASYLAWLDVSSHGPDDPVAVVLDHGGVALSDGRDFDPDHGRGRVRLNFGTPPAVLDRVIEGVARGLTATRAASGPR